MTPKRLFPHNDLHSALNGLCGRYDSMLDGLCVAFTTLTQRLGEILLGAS